MPRSALHAPSRPCPDLPKGLIRLLGEGLLPGAAQGAAARPRTGLDFATRDPLGLSRDPAFYATAPVDHARDPEPPIPALERQIAARLRLAKALTFASAVEAIRHALVAFLHPGDQVLVDSDAESAVFQAVLAAGAHLHRFPAASVDAVERRLRRLARQPRRGRLVIAVPAVSASRSRRSDLAELGLLARQHGALLVVDVAQDFGTMAQDGGGVLELQNCLGRVDLVTGSFAGCFGCPGGFAAFRDPAHGCGRPTGTAALPEGSAAAILAATRIVFGAEGRHRRRRLNGLSLRLRNRLVADGLRVPGSAAPSVPVLLPPATALPRTALLQSAGPRVGLLLAPLVPLHAPRWRIEISALHGLADIDDLAELIRDVTRAFDRLPSRNRDQAWGLTEAVT